MLGNPPWERIKLQEQEFFASRSERIAGAKNQAERHRLIAALSASEALPGERALARAFEEAKRAAEESMKDRTSAMDYAKAQAELAEAIAQLAAIQKLRRKMH